MHIYIYIYIYIYTLVADPGDGRRTRGHPLQHGRGRTQSVPVRNTYIYALLYMYT